MTEDVVNYDEIADWLREHSRMTSHKKQKQMQNLIAIACIPIVKKIAHTLARRSTDPVDDIIQVGSVGLLKAIRLYNPEISKNFKTYATYMITGEIRHYLRDKASMIKAPRTIQELAFRVNRITLEMAEEMGENPTENEVADKMALPVSQVSEAMEVDRRKQTISLDQIDFQMDEEFANWSDKIADLSYQNVEVVQEERIMLLNSLNVLDPALRDIIEMVYFKDLSQAEIGVRLGISQMQVSRRLKKALHELFNLITEEQLNG